MSSAAPTPPATPRVNVRPLVADDAAELTRIQRTDEVRRWWADPGPEFPFDEPEATRWTIEVDGHVAGLIEFHEEFEARYRHASIDLFLDPRRHGQGIGAEAIRRVVDHLIHEREHHRITIDPAADNAAAIRCYQKVGFTAVGRMRAYERDADGPDWHDGLLMELIVPRDE